MPRTYCHAARNARPSLPGGDGVETIAVYVGLLGLGFEVDSPRGLVAQVRALAARYERAVTPRG